MVGCKAGHFHWQGRESWGIICILVYSFQIPSPDRLMKKLLLLLTLAATLSLGRAQTFTVSPGNSVTHAMTPDRAVELYIHFENITGQPITFRWAEDSVSFPSQWLVQICDNAQCHEVPHPVDTMSAVMPADSGFLKLSVVPNNVPGTLHVCYEVRDLASGFSTDVCFAVDASGTAVESSALKARIVVSPSPANDQLHMYARHGNLEKGWARLYSLTGDVVLQQEVLPLQRMDLNVKELEAGIYLLRYTGKSGTMTQKVVVTH
jgi:hypothetical protein